MASSRKKRTSARKRSAGGRSASSRAAGKQRGARPGAAKRPAAKRPAAKRAAAKRPAAKRTAAKRPAAKRAAATRTAAKRTAAKRGAAKRTAAKRTAAKRGDVKRKGAKRPRPRKITRKYGATKRPAQQRQRPSAARRAALAHDELPYIKQLQQDGAVTVWQVDGDYIRRDIDEEFSNFGHHYSFSEIPKDEIWLDQEGHPDEQRFFIAHALVERRLMAEGKDYDTARIAADRVEREMRSRAGDLKRVETDREPVHAEAMHTRLWKALENGVHVWFVNGRLVRSVFDIEFTEGGHDYVYEFVPENEVWIDDDLHEDERGFVLFHELHERNLMAKGMDYDRAHDDSSRLEQHYRLHPAELHEGLSNEGWD